MPSTLTLSAVLMLVVCSTLGSILTLIAYVLKMISTPNQTLYFFAQLLLVLGILPSRFSIYMLLRSLLPDTAETGLRVQMVLATAVFCLDLGTLLMCSVPWDPNSSISNQSEC
ncbi:hypothetical protein GGR52DRAFT_66829 [Hypoxylon sp. FL1284]|nr:hypothetical protein GGR52DRAFT_66829 [Hypoxylon sp. FL1284]